MALATGLALMSGVPTETVTSVRASASVGALAAHCTDSAACSRWLTRAVREGNRSGRRAAPATPPPPAAAPSTPPPPSTQLPSGSATASVATAGATVDGAARVVVDYPPTDEVLANPERGFYHYTETRWSADGRAYTPLDVGQLTRWRTTEAVTLVYRVFYLGGLVDLDTVDRTFLTQVAADLAAARQAGVKLVVRFAYSPDVSRDAPPSRAVAHIRQLAPVLNAASDVVFVLQAGFIGRWGEWYYSDQYASDPARPWDLTDTDWARRRLVLDALLDSTATGIWVQVRYPAIKQRLLDAGDPRSRRVGVHNDCFLASDSDMGTFATAGDRTWLAGQADTVPIGGETCAVNLPRSGWDGAAADLAGYDWSFLNADFNRDVLSSWGDQVTTAARRLGYRLSLTSGSFPAAARRGETVPMELVLSNDGYAAPLSDRPVVLVFTQGEQTVSRNLPVRLRGLSPGSSSRLTVEVPVPQGSGTWALSLALPDAAPALAANPAYAVRLANQGLWDPATGRNDLRHSIRVG